jgi:hypothetical protein
MRNKLAGVFTGKSKTAKYYHDHPEARKKKEDYDTKYHSTPSRRKYRSILGALNREKGTYGNHDGKDLAHQSKSRVIIQSQSKNRGDKKHKFFK